MSLSLTAAATLTRAQSRWLAHTAIQPHQDIAYKSTQQHAWVNMRQQAARGQRAKPKRDAIT